MPIIVNLDVVMAKRKISLNELSDRVDLTLSNLSILKTGKAKAIRFNTLDAICKALDCQPGDILEYVNDKEKNIEPLTVISHRTSTTPVISKKDNEIFFTADILFMRLAKLLNTFTHYKKLGEMKKIMFIWLVLLLGLSYQAYAKAGMAQDEPEFILAIVGFLLLVAGFFGGIDYLIKDGKGLFKRFRTFLRKKVLTLRNSH
jgi:putative transcriptional regulator